MVRTIKSILIAIVMITLAAATHAAEIHLAWDAPGGTISGYRIYAVPVIENYNYSIPLYDGTATTCTVEVESNVELKFVARAYLNGEDGAVYESVDSNEVRHAVVVWANPNLRVQ